MPVFGYTFLYFMFVRILGLALLFCCLACFKTLAQAEAEHVTTTRIAFGSCNDQRKAQPLWQEIIKTDPALWVWLGDNIYADTDSMPLMQQYYNLQIQHPGYKKLLQTCPVTGIWSDHDYAGDNADKLFRKKQQSQQLFLDFMGTGKNEAIRKQEGIYRTYTLGEGNKKVKLILLDGNYHRDPFRKLFRLYLPDERGDILGEAQWAWLENELSNSDASVHIIVSGLQVLPHSMAYTNWSAYPAARARLLQLLEKTKPNIPLIISGDRHVGELSKYELQGYTQPLYEITSSGMTHFREAKKGGNRYRVGEQVGALNFGLLQINWGKDTTSITMQVRGEKGSVYIAKTVEYTLN